MTNEVDEGAGPRAGDPGLAPPGTAQYFTQPIEKDAESFGRRVIDLLPP